MPRETCCCYGQSAYTFEQLSEMQAESSMSLEHTVQSVLHSISRYGCGSKVRRSNSKKPSPLDDSQAAKRSQYCATAVKV